MSQSALAQRPCVCSPELLCPKVAADSESTLWYVCLCRDASKRLCFGLQEPHMDCRPAPSPAGPITAPRPPMGVEDMLTHIRTCKLTDSRPIKPVKAHQQQPQHDSDSVCLIGEDSGRIKWIQPSGGLHFTPMAVSSAFCGSTLITSVELLCAKITPVAVVTFALLRCRFGACSRP